MKREYRGIILLCLLLLLNIVVTQQVVNQYYFEHYRNVVIYALINIALFPIALWIYRREKDV